MSLDHLLSSIDAEILRLKQAHALLAGESTGTGVASARSKQSASGKKGGRKRVLSEEARKRIAEAQRKRWAAHKKAAGAK